jgi:tetratricopeptide (TPR) repeat protein
LSAAEVSRHWFGEGLTFVRDDPAAYLRLELRKLHLMLGGGEAPDIYSPRFEAAEYTPLYRVGVAQLPFILPFAIAGFALLGRRTPPWLLALAFVHVATLLIFYVSNRYRLPLEVLLLVPAAIALSRIYERRTRLLLIPGSLALILLLATSADEAGAARGKILVNLGASLGRRGEYEEAERAFRAAVAEDPEWARAHHYLGRAIAAQGRNDEAIGAYETASRLAPEALDVRLDLVAALGRGARGESAAESLGVAERLAIDRGDLEALGRVAQLWLALGDAERAADALSTIAAREPESAAAWERLGVARGLAGDAEAARAALTRAIQLDPSRQPSWEALVRALFELGRCEEARAHLLEAQRRTGAPAGAFDGVRAELERSCPE